MALLALCTLTLVFNVQPVRASGAIYIKADGSVDPVTAPISTSDNMTYTLTTNILESIVVERDNIVVDGAGFTVQGDGTGNGIDLSNRNNVTIKNTDVEDFDVGAYIKNSSNNYVMGNNLVANHVDGIWLESSSNNSVGGNNVTANNGEGIYLYSSFSNHIEENNVTANNGEGIYLYSSFSNHIEENNVTANNGQGIWLDFSSNNNVRESNLTANKLDGIYLYSSSSNSISGNNVTANNGNGIGLDYSSTNKFYHNNFAGNGQQVYSHDSTNIWDNGYPSGGNYWSNYNGTDLYNGPGQNITGSDGIGDTHYVIDSSNLDNYPLMNVYVSFEGQAIRIRADGNVDPSGAPIWRQGRLYAMTNDITSGANGIVIERDNIVLNGAGYTVTGSGIADGRAGATFTNGSNVTLENMTMANFTYGIYLYSSSGNTLSDNNVTNNDFGVELDHSSNNVLSGNNIANDRLGIGLNGSSDNALSGNNIADNKYGLWLYPSSNYNSISGNNMTANYAEGIYVDSSSNNNISGNSITNNDQGIYFGSSLNNSISENNVTAARSVGIWIQSSSNNSIFENNLTNNGGSIWLYDSSNNKFYHNDFGGSTPQVYSPNSTNMWDNGYPSGGNYWSDYNGTDLYNGPGQNITGSDGIGDTPYIIDVNNIDHYPLVNSWSPPDIVVTNLTSVKSVIGQGYTDLVNVTFGNLGNKIEAFNATFYANETSIGSETLMLKMGRSIVGSNLSTSGLAYGNYTLRCTAKILEGNVNITNSFNGGQVIVTIPG